MRDSFYLILAVAALLCTGCRHHQQEDGVISQKYIHKYGYAVSKEEFESQKCPGQVISTLRNGLTMTATYENGLLHGPSTQTFPHSNVVKTYTLYNQGNVVKQIHYDVSGMPQREEIQLSPTRYSTTVWYAEGNPMCMEEYAGGELLEGQYFNHENELDAQVIKGKGLRIMRDREGKLVYKDAIESGCAIKRETFFPNGNPESVAYFQQGKLHGEKRTFTLTGEPVAVKEYIAGALHGKSTFYKNGAISYEVHYLNGMKNGLETHYIDGEVVAAEVLWDNNKKHGPARYYVDGIAQTEYFYEGSKVNESKWQELNHLDEVISQGGH